MRVAFNVIDETIWFIDRPHEPWTVQAEARAAGRLDDERLRLAVRSALARHPMARARQAPWRFWQTGFTWEITEDAQVDALSIVDCPDHAAALLTELQRPKARIAPERAGDGPGYGFHLVRLDAEEMPALGSRRPPGATVNDVLLAALHLAIAEWNAEHGASCERIGVMMPVNLRPPERRNELVGNFSSFVSVATDREDRGRPEATLAA